MKLNPNAVVFWIISGIIGYLINDTTGALIGLVTTMSLSFILTLLRK